MKNLPLETQSFEILRSNDFLYVDKTGHIYRMIKEGRIYFLSRPRRFGKSLLVSTIDALFSGKKELFEGLYIYDKWDWSQQYPVIRLDWTQIDHSTLEKMEISMIGYLKEIAKNYRITLTSQLASDCFRELIRALYNSAGKKRVVVLIDEYDKPITGHLFDEQLPAIQTAVHDFYQVMKGADDCIQFIFITGVSKFSGLSVFSALNNPRDITLNERFAAICGYTQNELETNFSEYIDNVAGYLNMTRDKLTEQIRYWYNGYTWDGKTAIYNPFSTMTFFYVKRFNNYWFATGTPTFLIDIIQRRNRIDTALEEFNVEEKVLSAGYDPPKMDETPLLFQTGYLTIKKMKLIGGFAQYTLGIPNSEVSESFMTSLLEAYGKYFDVDINKLRKIMEQQIVHCDEAGFARSLEAMIATVPYELHGKNEAYYHTIMLIWMRLIGFKIQGEVSNNLGSADAVWIQPGVTVVAEIKYHKKTKINTLLKEAMKQIHEKRYYNPYLGKIILLGIAFSGQNVGCRMEIIENR
jgi:hypothetical protein